MDDIPRDSRCQSSAPLCRYKVGCARICPKVGYHSKKFRRKGLGAGGCCVAPNHFEALLMWGWGLGSWIRVYYSILPPYYTVLQLARRSNA